MADYAWIQEPLVKYDGGAPDRFNAYYAVVGNGQIHIVQLTNVPSIVGPPGNLNHWGQIISSIPLP